MSRPLHDNNSNVEFDFDFERTRVLRAYFTTRLPSGVTKGKTWIRFFFFLFSRKEEQREKERERRV